MTYRKILEEAAKIILERDHTLPRPDLDTVNAEFLAKCRSKMKATRSYALEPGDLDEACSDSKEAKEVAQELVNRANSDNYDFTLEEAAEGFATLLVYLEAIVDILED